MTVPRQPGQPRAVRGPARLKAAREGTVSQICFDAGDLSDSDDDCNDSDDDGKAEAYDFIGATGLAVGRERAGRSPGCWARFDAVLEASGACRESDGGRRVGVGGGGALGASLPGAIRFALTHLAHRRRLLVSGPRGGARSVALAVAILVAAFDNDEAASPRLALAAALPHLDDRGVREAVAVDAPLLLRHRLVEALRTVEAHRPTASLDAGSLDDLKAFFTPRSRSRPAPRAVASAPSDEVCPRRRPQARADRQLIEVPNAMSYRVPEVRVEKSWVKFLLCQPGQPARRRV